MLILASDVRDKSLLLSHSSGYDLISYGCNNFPKFATESSEDTFLKEYLV